MLGRLWKALVTALRLGCPRCGHRTLFRGWFTMNERCAVCDLKFEREPGYFIGAIYVNYTLTVLPMVGGFLLLDAFTDISVGVQLGLSCAIGIAFPLIFYRYSRSLWMAIDHLVNPQEPDLRLARSDH